MRSGGSSWFLRARLGWDFGRRWQNRERRKREGKEGDWERIESWRHGHGLIDCRKRDRGRSTGGIAT